MADKNNDKTATKPAKRFWHKGRVIRYAVISTLLILIFSVSPLVLPTQNLSPSQAAQARAGAAKILKPLMSTREKVNITVTPSHLEAISDTISYTVPALQFRLNSNAYGILIASSVTTIPGLIYLNFSCWLTPEFSGSLTFTQCKVGSLPIPGSVIEYFAKGMARVFFGKEALITLNNILANTQLDNDQVVVTFDKPENLKASVEDRLTDTFKMVQEIRQINGADTDTISLYLDYISSHEERAQSSAELIGKTFLYAQKRSIEEDPVDENYAALWALAMTFGAPDFARIVAMPIDYSIALPDRFNLRGRLDLRLHFFFSVALRLASEKQLSINIGKLKEVMDSSKGGSGYSFRDLTADKSGVELADFAISSEENARRVQQILAASDTEDLFIPLLHDLPEGLSEKTFNEVFGSEDDPRYTAMESDIDARIAALPVYTDSPKNPVPTIDKVVFDRPVNTETINSAQQWYQVDTHTHSRFSDGEHSIKKIAENANSFGCDAVAITDHGDRNLKGVFSDKYWQDFEEAMSANPDLTLIAGLEWNIPPFAGREHVTVLLPENNKPDKLISVFRERFDHYGKTTAETINESFAFKWLNEQFANSFVTPVVLYNHPSRKDQVVGENVHDMQKWRSQSPFVIGFSGAPGHQKKRGEYNGSYNYKFRTLHGWDPAIAIPDSDWDKLLGQGIQTYGARAPSDFHNTKMDYWPCEFSTTHILSPSQRTNDLLTGLTAGHYWAQHGKFVKQIDANVFNDLGKAIATAGDVISTPEIGLTASLIITLNDKDWQGFNTSLDVVIAVLITERGVETKEFYPDAGKKEYSFDIAIPSNSEITAVRWFGRSVQPELHHYQFFTNPVMIRWQTQ